MTSSINVWMGLAGVVYLVVGGLAVRAELRAAAGWDKLVGLGAVFIAAALAAFAPEHFGGPVFVQNMVPSWMPWHGLWAPFIGFALLAAATSLAVRKLERLASTLLGLMFVVFVCTIYLPSLLGHLDNRLAWIFVFRDLSFAAGAWALAGWHGRASSPRRSSGLILFARIVIATAATLFGVEQLLHPAVAPGVPLTKLMPSWVPLPGLWGYLVGGVLVIAGISLALNRRARAAATAIGGLATVLTVFLYVPMLILSLGGSPAEVNEAINYVADTLLFAGSALALAAALPRD